MGKVSTIISLKDAIDKVRKGRQRCHFSVRDDTLPLSRNPISLPPTVGLALNEQLLPIGESVPADETDWTVDALVLGDGSVLQPERG